MRKKTNLFLDLETYSDTPITAGSHAYAEKSKILLLGYAINDEPAKVWDLTADPKMPKDLKAALDLIPKNKVRVIIHNGFMFDVIVMRHNGIDIPNRCVYDTMVMAYEAGLPGKLADLSTVFRLPVDKAKDKDGKRLIRLFCAKQKDGELYDRTTHPEDWAHFVDYCRLDIEAMREIFKLLPKFNGTNVSERQLQLVDAEINQRGMLMDTELAQAAFDVNEQFQEKLKGKVSKMTNGAVESATLRDQLISYIEAEYGWKLDSMTSAELSKRIEDPDTPEPVRELLRVRLSSAKASVKKFAQVLSAVSSDGRLRGCLQFRGAARTGRWSGRLFQPQNLARPTIGQDEIDLAIKAVKSGCFDMFYDNPSDILPSLLRGLIIAPQGKKLVVADYSNVEGRVLAWLAGEEWKLQAFRDFDAGHGHDLYKMTYGRTFNIKPEDVTKPQRQMGKVLELALGYGGGAGAFVTFAKGYGIDLNELAVTVKETINPLFWQEAESSYVYLQQKGQTKGLDREVFIACDAVKRAWRKANEQIARFWYDLGQAVADAMRLRQTITVGPHLQVEPYEKSYLLIRLPSGRYLSYPSARIEPDGSFGYYGLNQYTRQWGQIRSYGAKLVENVTQAVACDLLGESLLRMSPLGYAPVLTVHDEVITEVPDTPEYSLQGLTDIMTTLPDWAAGLPLAAAGFESYRYKKD